MAVSEQALGSTPEGEEIPAGVPPTGTPERASPEELRRFMRRLLDDVSALEHMLSTGQVERGKRRIGAEQEFVLVQGSYRPALVNMELLQTLDDDHFTTELARYNVEMNLDPLELGGDCFARMHADMETRIARLREAASRLEAEVVLTGILPTLRIHDLDVANMTPNPRYAQLNDALNRLRGGAYEIRINGTDELLIKQDSVMLESANTSFQIHLQVDPEEFAPYYNISQAIAAPVLAAATNSPVLFGRRLWKETRIAVFQQAIDTRTSSYYLHDHSSRVYFGRRWVEESALELFQESITRHRTLLDCGPGYDDPFESLRAGHPPGLKALQLHNSTVYRWNRPCYGVYEGKAHLRIENRVLPAGPTPIDEVANAAFWVGLMYGMRDEYGDVQHRMEFDDARGNFIAAARNGLSAQLTWMEDTVPANQLILETLLPLARRGLESNDVRGADIERYLGVIEERVRLRRTGSHWMLASLAKMEHKGTLSQKLCALTAATIARQQEGTPVHEWPLARFTAGSASFKQAYMRVEQIMTTDVVAVNEEEHVDLVARIMDWHNLRYVPVEDRQNNLAGLISHRVLLRYLTGDRQQTPDHEIPVREIMHKADLVTVPPETLTLDALELMRKQRLGCLPVVKQGRLVGMLTDRNFLTIAGQLLEDQLREES